MPIYQYSAAQEGCDRCQAGFEIMQSMGDPPLAQCPACGAAVKKCLSLFNGGTPLLGLGNLRDKGFTKLKNRGDGIFEKLT